jgi:predicted RNA-binding protein YlxR (DUF448 family)
MNITTKKNKTPIRRCIVTGEKLDKKSLLRLVKTPDGELCIDLTGKKNGRGAYIKKDASIIPLLIQKKLIERTFSLTPSPTFYDQLIEVIHG